MSTAFTRLREEDPTIQIRYDPQTKETVVSGMGRAHVEIVAERLKRKFGVDVTLKTPRVPYKETIKARAREVQGRHKKQTGGRGQFGDCWIHMEPMPRGGGFEFVEPGRGGRHSPQLHPGGGEGRRGGHGAGADGRLPGGGPQGDPVRRLHPPRGLLGDGVQAGGAAGLPDLRRSRSGSS